MSTGGSTTEVGIPLKYGYRTFWPHEVGTTQSSGLGLGNGTPIIAESVASSGQQAILFDVAGDVALWQENLDDLEIDLSRDIHCRVGFLSIAADPTADAIVFIATAKGVAAGEAEGLATTSPDGIVTFDAIIPTAQNVLMVSPWRNLGVAGELTADRILQLSLECDSLGAASTNEIRGKFLEIRYTKKITTDNDVRELT